MKTKSFSLTAVAGLTVAVTILAALSPAISAALAEKSAHRAQPAQIERGRYLVHGVGLCIDCHSPRHADGTFIAAQHLTGAPIPFAPTVSMPWVALAPRLAGLPAGYSESDLVHFLMSGERPNGRPPALPPMPPYRLNRPDAEAVTAYLKSLSSPPRQQ